jgi:hypothetical protein
MEILRNFWSKYLGNTTKEPEKLETSENLEEFAEAMVNVLTDYEYEEVKSTPPTVEVIKPGDSQHKHSLRLLPWEEELGKKLTDIHGYTATFKYRYGCEDCKREVIVSRKALI